MPWYNDLRPVTDEKKIDYALIFPSLTNNDRKRIIENILELRVALDNEIPLKKIDSNLILGSWNIKELGHLKNRLPESFFYMAETINRFDLIAIQEIKSSLNGLNKLMKLLGSNWSYIITDITEGKAGNKERFGYIYDKRKVNPSGLSGEIVLWDEITKGSKIKQLKRSPAITGFKAGWKKFAIINVHLQPSKDKTSQEYRKEEVRLLMEAIKAKDKKKHFWNDNLLLMGDTNLYKKDNEAIEIINSTGFRESEGLIGKPTNTAKEKEIYDRIFLRVNEYFKLIKDNGKEKGGVFEIYNTVFSTKKRKDYHSKMRSQKEDSSNLKSDEDFDEYYHRYWRGNQISDHNPIWIEIEIDSSEGFLMNKLEELKKN